MVRRASIALVYAVFTASLTLLASQISLAQTMAPFREYTLEHPKPESRTQWRVPQVYLSRMPYHRDEESKPIRKIIVVDAALPDMRAWWTSGLDRKKDNDAKLEVSIAISAGYDFAVEKRILPRMIEKRLEHAGPFGDGLLKYERKEQRSGAPRDIFFYLIPEQPRRGKAVFFKCVRRCIASADFSENVHVQYDFDLSLIAKWPEIDQKVRELLSRFQKS